MILAKRGATLVAEVARLPPDDAEGNRNDTMMVNDLQTVADELHSNNESKVEVADELLVELDILTDSSQRLTSHTRQPILKSTRDNLPIEYKLYDISDGSEFNYIAIEQHSKQQGPRYNIPYIIGIGNLSIQTVHAPTVDEMQTDLKENARKLNIDVPVPSRKDIEKLREGIMITCEWYVNEKFESNIYSMVFDGTYVYITPSTGRWDGMNHIIRGSDVPDEEFEEQLRDVQDDWTHRVRGFNADSSRHPFKIEIGLTPE